MPRMDGYELTRPIRRSPRLAAITIIMMMSRTGEKHRRTATDLWVNRYLGEPYQEAELRDEISAVLMEAPAGDPSAKPIHGPSLSCVVWSRRPVSVISSCPRGLWRRWRPMTARSAPTGEGGIGCWASCKGGTRGFRSSISVVRGRLWPLGTEGFATEIDPGPG